MYIMDFKMKKTSEIAKFLINDHQNNIKYRNLPKSLKTRDINEAYLAQKEFQENCGRGKHIKTRKYYFKTNKHRNIRKIGRT